MSSDGSVAAYVRQFRLDRLIDDTGGTAPLGINDTVDPNYTVPYAADWPDLVRLHDLVMRRRVVTILEFGVGKSSVVMADALKRNREQHAAFVSRNLRRNNPFELHSVDDMADFVAATGRIMPEHLSDVWTSHLSAVEHGTFNGRVCTFYQSLPNICPDLIYLDGPSQFSARGEIRGLSTRHKDRLPMSADILAMEHFLLPGTLIVVDGRTANARFLRCNLQRGWAYRHDEDSDVHLFELRERPLGKYNRAQIEFCLGSEWLRAVDAGDAPSAVVNDWVVAAPSLEPHQTEDVR